MKVTIETKDQAVIASVQPLVAFAESFKGSINASYRKGGHYVHSDVTNKKELYQGLQSLNQQGSLVIGCGSGHVYVSIATATRIEWSFDGKKIIEKEPMCVNGIHDRVLLITDNDEQ